MQDRFVGDIGDFGKYGLLRAICGIAPRAEPKRSLGLCGMCQTTPPLRRPLMATARMWATCSILAGGRSSRVRLRAL